MGTWPVCRYRQARGSKTRQNPFTQAASGMQRGPRVEEQASPSWAESHAGAVDRGAGAPAVPAGGALAASAGIARLPSLQELYGAADPADADEPRVRTHRESGRKPVRLPQGIGTARRRRRRELLGRAATASLSIIAHITVPASASSPAGSCSLVGTLKLAKAPTP